MSNYFQIFIYKHYYISTEIKKFFDEAKII